MPKQSSERSKLLHEAAAWIGSRAGDLDTRIAATAVSALLEAARVDPGVTRAQVRKHAVILFADVVGFTSLSETLDPELVTELVNALWEGIDLLVLKWGGSIDKHIGDAVMALWGDRTAREDDVERAARCALGMLEWLAVFNERFRFPDGSRLGAPLRLRVGLHAGTVLIGPIGTIGERSAIGDAVNTAARVQSAAEPGTALSTEAVFRAVSGAFEFEEAGTLEVKGKSEAVRSYRIKRAKDRPDRAESRGIEGIAVPMVGRSSELTSLRDAFALAKTGCRRVALVGDAGIGKSRLLREFIDELESGSEAVPIYRGRCAPGSSREPHSILKSVFAHGFRILDTDSPLDSARKFESGVAAVLGKAGATPASGDLSVAASYLGFSGEREAVDDPRGFAAKALSLVRAFFDAAASTRIVVALEDLHWADPGSLVDLETTLGAGFGGNAVVVTTARPVNDQALSDFLDRFCDERLALPPLRSDDALELARSVFRGFERLPDAISDLVSRKAEGVPYYVEELARMLFDSGVVDRRSAPWRFDAAKLSAAKVPATLAGLLQARIDALPKGEREVLLAASVVGRTFWDGSAAVIARKPPAVAATALDSLAAKELVFPKTTSAFAGLVEYDFKHALLRDAAYSNILLKDRPAYHRAAARWIGDHSGARGEAFAPQVAWHLELAGRPAEAAAYYAIAAKAAASANDATLALSSWDKAVSLSACAPGEERFRYLAGRERTLDRLGNREAQRRDLETLSSLADSAPDPVVRDIARSVNASRWSNYHELTGDYSGAFEYAERALAICEERLALGVANARDAEILKEIRARAIYLQGRARWRHGRLPEAVELLEKAVKTARRDGFRQTEALALRNLGAAVFHSGDVREAIRLTAASLEICRAIGDDSGTGSALNNLADEYRFLGRWERARETCAEAFDILSKVGDAWTVVIAHANLATINLRLGDLDSAERHAMEGLARAEVIGLKNLMGSVATTAGHILRARGRLEEAAARFRNAIAIEAEIGSASREAEARGHLAEILHALGRTDEARAALEPSLAVYGAGALDGAEEPFFAAVAVARFLRATGDDRWREVVAACARALRTDAERIPDDESRADFLGRVSAHVELLAMEKEAAVPA